MTFYLKVGSSLDIERLRERSSTDSWGIRRARPIGIFGWNEPTVPEISPKTPVDVVDSLSDAAVTVQFDDEFRFHTPITSNSRQDLRERVRFRFRQV